MSRRLASGPARFTAAAGAALAVGYLAIGTPGMILAAIAAALWLIWRFDNWTGSCLMIAVLLLLVLGVLTLLLGLMALPR